MIASGGRAGRRPAIEWTRISSLVFSLVAAGVFLGMIALFLIESLPAWGHRGVTAYLFGERWFFRREIFGVLPMIFGTTVVSGIALALAAPVGIGAAVFSAEYLGRRTRLALKGAIELLAGVPSVVYGLLGVLVLRDWIYRLLEPWEPLSGDTLLTGGVLLGVMILPTVMTFSDDALRGVGGEQRKAARALGLTRGETVLKISLPQALPGLAAALLLALGRALGETIAVFLVIGRQDNQLPETFASLSAWLRAAVEPGQTLTSKLGGSETFIAYGEPLHWAAMMGLAVALLALVLSVTLVGARFGAGRGIGGGRAGRSPLARGTYGTHRNGSDATLD